MLNNLFAETEFNSAQERFDDLLSGGAFRMERIVSEGHCSDDEFWYDQDEHEWVVVLSGSATLEFQEPDETLDLQAGGFVNIPAHRRHRVAATSPNEKTVWLAIFYRD